MNETSADSPSNVASLDSKRPATNRTMRKQRNPWPTRIIIALVLIGVVVLIARSSKKKPISVEIVKVERGAVRDEISSSTAGEVMAEHNATVRAELSGRVLAVRHKRGERVKKGETIIALDAADLDAKLKEAEATLESQRAQAAQSDAHAEASEHTAQREKNLAAHGAETAQVADDSAAQAREAVAAAKAAHGQLDQSTASLQAAKVARSHAELTAPFDGLLADVMVEAGDEVQIGTNVFQIVDDSRVHVEATIDEADIERVRVGQSATLRLDALPDHPIAGTVSKMDPTVRKDDKGARTLRLEVEVSDLPKALEQGLRVGMSANVDVRVAEKQNVLSVPSNVIVGRGTKRTVFLIQEGIVHEQPVQIGMSSWDRSEILSGVSEGDSVVSNLNAKGLADGVPVTTAGAPAS